MITDQSALAFYSIKKQTMEKEMLLDKARQIRLVLSDVDGVLTDNGVYYSYAGEVMKRFSIRDGMGVERLRKLAGVETGIVTGELSVSVQKRAEKLQITELHLGIKDKAALLDSILSKKGLTAEQVAFIGDDVNDIGIMKRVGFCACPADAMPQVTAIAHYHCFTKGGYGAFRELAELIIEAQSIEHPQKIATTTSN
jgi:3-deoxy-D-manno-octulosonate 8-phosphate phosphatase (KDO 8-P phosphatase)